MSTKPLADNPHGDKFLELEDDGRRFVVLHTGVGQFKAGDAITARHLGPGAELPRLVALKAIRELSPSEAEGVELAPIVSANELPVDPQFTTGNPHTEALGRPHEDPGVTAAMLAAQPKAAPPKPVNKPEPPKV